MPRVLDLSNRKRASLKPSGAASYRCPDCGHVTVLRPGCPVRAGVPARIAFHCRCGCAHTVYVEKRAPRTNLDAPAAVVSPRSDIRITGRVRNISFSGILLELEDGAEMRLGDELEVEFPLEHVRTSHITRTIRVRRIAEAEIGAEFVDERTGPEAREFELALTQLQVGLPARDVDG